MTISAFVIGHPIAHSRSPLIHGTWLADNEIDGRYEAIDVTPDDLPAFFERLRSGEFAGGNVTIPHKQAVFALCDSLDPLARSIGAVNTLVVRKNKVHGTNTDYLGFLGNLDANQPGWAENLDMAIVLGAGGAARAILVALAARGISSVKILNRTIEAAERLAEEIEGPFEAGRLEDFAELAPNAGLVVNTTAIGMHGTRFDTLPLEHLAKKSAIVTDIVYSPLLTPLLADAATLGLRTVDGLGMLLHQAVPGFEAWFGVRPTVTPDLHRRIAATL